MDQALEAWDYRNQGLSLRDIAKKMSLSGPQQAKNLVERGYTAFYSPKVAQRRAESDDRLHSLLAQVMPITLNKKKPLEDRLAAMDRAIKLDREIRQLHGVDAPETSVTLTGEVAVKDVRQRILDRLSSLAAAAAARAPDPQPE